MLTVGKRSAPAENTRLPPRGAGWVATLTMQNSPTDLRSTFELFRFYRPEIGLQQLLRNSDVSQMSPRQIYQAVHDRAPETLEEALAPPDYDPIAHFVSAVSSKEFQTEIAGRLLRAFPEKRRLFFVHIPKTAGVELANHLQSRYASINRICSIRH